MVKNTRVISFALSDKERYDLLNNMAKVFRDECNVDIDKECALHTDSLPELTGKLTPEDIDEIKEVLEHTIGEFHDKTQELYCTKLDYITSNGLRVFFMLVRATKPQGCNIIIKGANKLLMDVFDSTGFTDFFTFIK